MRQRRALVVMVCCAIGALLGMSSAVISDVIMTRCSSGTALTAGTGCEERLGASGMTDGTTPKVPITSTATRHVPGPGEPPRRGPNPATDRAMVLLIGWAMLVTVGSGLFMRTRPRREPEPPNPTDTPSRTHIPVPTQRAYRRVGPRQLTSPLLDQR